MSKKLENFGEIGWVLGDEKAFAVYCCVIVLILVYFMSSRFLEHAQTVPVHPMQCRVLPEALPRHPYAHTHGRASIRVWCLSQTIHTEINAKHSQAYSHGLVGIREKCSFSSLFFDWISFKKNYFIFKFTSFFFW